jgi:sugar phosphate isomerase/epimerase
MLFGKRATPEEWALAAKEAGYEAVYFPVDYTAEVSVIDGYVKAAKEHELVIAEIGVWNNTLARDPQEREKAVQKAVRQLELADYAGVRCCVNVAGSYGEQWDGPHKDNLTQRAFEEIVLTTQKIIDAACPKTACYSLEPMPWMYPDSADSYLRLLQCVNRKHFGVHVDMVNVINSPEKYYRNGEIIREWFEKLGDHIVSCHAKDIRLTGELTVHLEECRPGSGELDYQTYISCVEKLNRDTCLMLEHMTGEADYAEALRYLKSFLKR